MHQWGDDWFKKHGDNLHKAIMYCNNTWRKYGRITAFGKEKYGTFRDQLFMWDGGLHSLIWPGYNIRNKFISFKLDKYIIRPLFRYTGIYYCISQYQKIIYNYAIQKMCKKYPDIIDELILDLDGYEMIKPSIFGKINGIKIHNKYWETYE
jgi:hypothetical protein